MKYKFLLLNILKNKKLCRFAIAMFVTMSISYFSILGLKSGIYNKYEQLKYENINLNYFLLKSQNKSYKQVIKDIENMGYIKKYYPVVFVKINDNYFIYEDCEYLSMSTGKCVLNKNKIVVSEFSKSDINDNISVLLNNKEYSFEVIGKYNLKTFSFNEDITNPVIVSKEFIESLEEKFTNEVVVQIDDYDSKEKLLDDIYNIGKYDISFDDNNTVILERYKSFYNILNNLSNVLKIFIFLIILIVSIIIIYDNKFIVALMKSEGYSNLKISLIILFYICLLFTISIFLGLAAYFLLAFFFNKLMCFLLNIILQFILIYFIINIFIFVILYFVIKKVNVIKLLGD